MYMVDERDAEDAIRKLDGREVGYKRRPLKVQWAKVRARSWEPARHSFVQRVLACTGVAGRRPACTSRVWVDQGVALKL